MRILLAHNSLYFPSHGGGDKSNRLLMAALAARGHEVRVLARTAGFGTAADADLRRELDEREVPFDSDSHGVSFALDGVEVRVFARGGSLRPWVAARMRESRPDIVLTSTDDPAHLMLEAALGVETARVVFLVRAIVALPFGPECPMPSERKTAELRLAEGVVAVSAHLAAYARQWGGLDAVHVPISLPDSADPPSLGGFGNRYITMINPCAGKGISIFLALAARFPEAEFAAVPTWGTTAADIAALHRIPNVTVLQPADDADEIYAQTRIALVPSLWAEARSRVILEAMARAIPVLASNVGGLAEAILGMDYLLPVRPARQLPQVDETTMTPAVETPAQDIEPWAAALGRLLSDRDHYEDLSRRVRERALAASRECTVEPFERYLEQVLRAPRKARVRAGRGAGRSELSPERRRLLAARLKRKQGGGGA